eukprot:5063915-Lingulodinium_polyedra.AAC.1
MPQPLKTSSSLRGLARPAGLTCPALRPSARRGRPGSGASGSRCTVRTAASRGPPSRTAPRS